jgi:hypothetical protein
MKYPVDVSIYLDQFKNSLIDDVALQQTLEDDGIEDFEFFNKLLFEEIEMCALDNFNECEDPTLNEEQFWDCIRISIAQYHIDLLQEQGLLESIYDDADGIIKYRLSNKGLATTQANLNHN